MATGKNMNDEEQLKIIVREAVGSAVRETLLSLGLDVADPIKMQQQMVAVREIAEMFDDDEFKSDMIHLRRWRKSMDAASNVGIKTAIAFIVTGFFGMMVFAIKTWLEKH